MSRARGGPFLLNPELNPDKFYSDSRDIPSLLDPYSWDGKNKIFPPSSHSIFLQCPIHPTILFDGLYPEPLLMKYNVAVRHATT